MPYCRYRYNAQMAETPPPGVLLRERVVLTVDVLNCTAFSGLIVYDDTKVVLGNCSELAWLWHILTKRFFEAFCRDL